MTKTTATTRNKPGTLRYIGYIRKSTEDAEKQVLSLQAQKEKILERFKDIEIIDILEESKSAFEPDKRPVFKQILSMLDKGEVAGIVAWHPDRLSRNEVDASAITWRLRQGKVKDLKFANFTFDNSPEGIMMLQMTMSQSQYFSAKLSKDVKRGNEQKRKNGGLTGIAPEGYLNDRIKKTIKKDPVRFPLIRQAVDLYLTGEHSVQDILRTMNDVWGYKTVKRNHVGGNQLSRTALYHIFSNIRYAGWIPETHNPELLYPANFPALMTMDEYDQIQLLLGRRGNRRFGSRKQFALRGFIRCGECDCLVTAENKTKVMADGKTKLYTYYHCTHKKKTCSQRTSKTEDALYQECVDLLDDHELIPELYEWSMDALRDLQDQELPQRQQQERMQDKAIAEVEAQLDKLLDMSTRELIDEAEFTNKNRKLKAELKQLHKQQSRVGAEIENWYDYLCDVISKLTNANYKFANGDIAVKKDIMLAIGQKPVLLDGKLQITPNEWIIPIKENAKLFRAEIKKVLTGSEQMRTELLEALRLRWYT